MNEGTRNSFPRTRRRRFEGDWRTRYGVIYVTEGSAAQSSIGTSFTAVTGWATDGPAAGVMPEAANGRLVVEAAGMYQVQAALSFTGTASTKFTFLIYLNGVVTGAGAGAMLDGSGNQVTVSMIALLNCGPGDLIEVYVKADGASKEITLVEAQLVAHKVSSFEYEMTVMS